MALLVTSYFQLVRQTKLAMHKEPKPDNAGGSYKPKQWHKAMLHLPSELRLMIYRFVLIHDNPIPLSMFFALDSSLIRTCSLFRHEGISLFYESNRFLLQTTDFTTIEHLCRRFEKYSNLIQYMILDFRFKGRTNVDLIWNLMRTQQEVEPIVKGVLGRFRSLNTLSIQLTTSCNCLQHRTQIEEVLCTSFQVGCTELNERIRDQCCTFGILKADYLDDESMTITLSTPRTTISNI
jgi:hypothetical protein